MIAKVFLGLAKDHGDPILGNLGVRQLVLQVYAGRARAIDVVVNIPAWVDHRAERAFDRYILVLK